MSEGVSPTMLPTSVCSLSAPNSYVSHLSPCQNTPEEDDETMNSEQREASLGHKAVPPLNLNGHRRPSDHTLVPDDSMFCKRGWNREQFPPASSSFCSSRPPHSLPAGYSQPTPFPSQVNMLHPSFASSWTGYPNSLPSCLSQKEDSSCSEDSCLSRCKSASLPGQHTGNMMSLEQPLSLRSNPPSAELYHHTLSPYSCQPQGPACCAQCPADAFSRPPMANKYAWPQHSPAYSPFYPGECRIPGAGFTHIGQNVPVKERHPTYSTPLSLEQRRVFVTYEADNDKHVNEIIKFVALLRHNGFDTHIDIFEQQYRSISKIDFMERYLSEKEYLIIIIISPKYYETVTTSPFDLENDERTFNTVYIYKQLQNEFIQNGSKNFRFIPILFPGAKKCHVPNWLQNTHVYGWPRDRDDILRRLMRVEKYNPPPIGELPTIVSIPI
ncbi:E3 ubiquitin ligase TRAF3IP2-like [Cyprinodon tularosa]|uniref:E3 ubiquitin ligase TRAF3IP2-like n=1 Tax=Cyprinodon tularosa TaxID=77115 RepID=UPI0018E1E3D5|nr:E3 ubiquitin ligase TRAF3IP2-like [Cyprinodon tularosa]XP_038131762.1 E3 ubiquitin ligase TRAF3IP2-like [Cyprinodon tularosa]